jgi:hypothetical protein
MNAISDYTAPVQENNVEASQQQEIILEQAEELFLDLDPIEELQPQKGSVALVPEQVTELEDYVRDLIMNNGHLVLLAELLVEYNDLAAKLDYGAIGLLMDHHTEIISGTLGLIEGFFYANKVK